ncbi:hypothetical protein PINS_up008742 [Pythium insidiosum]|nr:hypothetical protein PINS_up008742 [Pythium insidiosum]
MPSSAASASAASATTKQLKHPSKSNDGPANTLSKAHLTVMKSTNKIVPEDQPPPPPLTQKEKIVKMLENRYISTWLALCTIFALFGDDVRVSFLSKSADNTIYNLLFVCFIFFSIELILNVYARPMYFNKGLGGAFYLDMVSTLSIIPDVGWIWVHVIGETSNGKTSSGQAAALRAGRASRAGTRAGRIVRLVRLFRMLRILRVVKEKNKDADIKVAISEPSKIGKVLTEKTTRRLILLVLLIIIVSPIIDGSVDQTQDDFQVSQLNHLHRYGQDYNATGDISRTHFRHLVEQYVRDSNGLIVSMSISKVPPDLLRQWLKEMTFQQPSSTDDWQFETAFTLTANPNNGWTADKYLIDNPDTKYRSNEYTTVETFGCYKDNKCTDCNTATVAGDTCQSYVTFDVSSYQRQAAKLNIGKTLIVIFSLAVSMFVLTRDAELLVIGPIERMMRLVTQLAENPLGATEAKRELYEEDEKSAEDYETRMLELTLGKIGRLLQVGFGAAGTEIIAKNMGGANELDVMIPGKKITSIFGFGIIEHFTETCALLEEDIITYINTIAEIVHSDAKVFHGAANKNIGAAFLLAWKMCDGALPGMRDPRDPADKPRMDPAEKTKRREGIYVKSVGSGTVPRRITPQELVDSALAAVLKMRVDLHNANHHGSLHKYCTKQEVAHSV